MVWWWARSSAGSSVVQTTATLNLFKMPWTESSGVASVGLLPNLGGVGLIDEEVDAEIAAQLEVRPVMQRIADGLRDGAGVGEELVVVAGDFAGDEILGHPVGAHGPPLVMVPGEPDLGEILELPVGGDLLGRQVAVIVENGLRRGVLVVEPSRGLGREEEIFVEKRSRGGHGGNREGWPQKGAKAAKK